MGVCLVIKKFVFLAAGGDQRQSYLANRISEYARVYAYGLDKELLDEDIISIKDIDEIKEPVDYVVLPLPVTNDGVHINMPFLDKKISLYSLIPLLSHNAVIFGGKIEKEVAAIFTYKGFEVIDYLEREELTVLNAVPTVLTKKHSFSNKDTPASNIYMLTGVIL